MTLAEITQVITAYNENYKMKLQENYSNAVMIATFVLQGLNGKKMPKFEELYPDLAQNDNDDNSDQAMQLYKEQFMDFANRHNKLKHGGKQ